jgi:cell division protease FtsH
MVMEYGMSDILGPMQYGKPNGEVFLGRDYSRQQDYSDEVAANIDNEVRKMINAAHEEARLILETHADAMQRMVDKLMDKETVDRQEVAELFSDVPKWEHTSEGAMRLRYPENPVIPQPRDEPIAAAEEAETEDEPVTESLTLNRKLRRSTRPATDAGA